MPITPALPPLRRPQSTSSLNTSTLAERRSANSLGRALGLASASSALGCRPASGAGNRTPPLGGSAFADPHHGLERAERIERIGTRPTSGRARSPQPTAPAREGSPPPAADHGTTWHSLATYSSNRKYQVEFERLQSMVSAHDSVGSETRIVNERLKKEVQRLQAVEARLTERVEELVVFQQQAELERAGTGVELSGKAASYVSQAIDDVVRQLDPSDLLPTVDSSAHAPADGHEEKAAQRDRATRLTAMAAIRAGRSRDETIALAEEVAQRVGAARPSGETVTLADEVEQPVGEGEAALEEGGVTLEEVLSEHGLTLSSADENVAQPSAYQIDRAASAVAEINGQSVAHNRQMLAAALAAGASMHEASAVAVSNSVEETIAALLALYKAESLFEGQDMGADVLRDSLLAASSVAAQSVHSGASNEIAVKAGQNASVSVASGATLSEMLAEVTVTAPQPPGWSLEMWLSAVPFNRLIAEAILKRMRAAVEGMKATEGAAYELAFVTRLGKLGADVGTETILALLKETPVLTQISEAICEHARALGEELNSNDVDEAREAKTSLADSPPLSAEQMNEQFKSGGAFTLSYCVDAAVYWEGLGSLVGKPTSPLEQSVHTSMFVEHAEAVDSDAVFEVGNYGTLTTSKAEWFFASEPESAEALASCGLKEWPGLSTRSALPPSHFKPHWTNVDMRLGVVGEQPLSLPEFLSLRLYTGPMYIKYNGVLRSHSGVPFLKTQAERLCLGNGYTNTLHVLSASILKLGKIVKVATVYRAPGGALPTSFWAKQPEGVQGGLELAFMSTTTAKEEAMAYARRAPGMILFEIHQGFVARGASISWLSQYPNEEEILFPPLTTLEVTSTSVDGAVIIVSLRASLKEPGSLKAGVRDIEEADNERARLHGERKQAERLRKEELRRQQWEQSMQDVRITAAQRKHARVEVKRASQQHDLVVSRFKMANDEEKIKILTTAQKMSEEAAATAVDQQHAAESAMKDALKLQDAAVLAKEEAEVALEEKAALAKASEEAAMLAAEKQREAEEAAKKAQAEADSREREAARVKAAADRKVAGARKRLEQVQHESAQEIQSAKMAAKAAEAEAAVFAEMHAAAEEEANEVRVRSQQELEDANAMVVEREKELEVARRLQIEAQGAAESAAEGERRASKAQAAAEQAAQSEREKMEALQKETEEQLARSNEALQLAEQRAEEAFQREKRAMVMGSGGRDKDDDDDYRKASFANTAAAPYIYCRQLRKLVKQRKANAQKEKADAQVQSVYRSNKHRPLDADCSAAEVVARLDQVMGPMDKWKLEGVQAADLETIRAAMKQLLLLCTTDKGENKTVATKSRKEAASAGIFDQMSNIFRRYNEYVQESLMSSSGSKGGLDTDVRAEVLFVFLRSAQALAAVLSTKKEKELVAMQTDAKACLLNLAPVVKSLLRSVLEPIWFATRNNEENTLKLLRAGGAEVIDWLAPESKVTLPERYLNERAANDKHFAAMLARAESGAESNSRPASPPIGKLKPHASTSKLL